MLRGEGSLFKLVNIILNKYIVTVSFNHLIKEMVSDVIYSMYYLSK